MSRKLFCELCPAAYKISLTKEIFLRNIKDFLSREKIARTYGEKLSNVVKSHTSIICRELHGVDMSLQKNKLTNITLAAAKVNGIVINPDETFSFWKTVGKTGEKQGYKKGLVIGNGNFSSDFGGGLCQLANMIHYLVLNSPLQVTELHHHTDALFPDSNRRTPFGTGTSVFYNNIDYRFKNITDQKVGFNVWVENGELCAELVSEREFPFRYKLVEENHHFQKEGEDYYRVSQVIKVTVDRKTSEEVKREVILNNHSKVMYDHALIPKDEIW